MLIEPNGGGAVPPSTGKDASLRLDAVDGVSTRIVANPGVLFTRIPYWVSDDAQCCAVVIDDRWSLVAHFLPVTAFAGHACPARTAPPQPVRRLSVYLSAETATAGNPRKRGKFPRNHAGF